MAPAEHVLCEQKLTLPPPLISEPLRAGTSWTCCACWGLQAGKAKGRVIACYKSNQECQLQSRQRSGPEGRARRLLEAGR